MPVPADEEAGAAAQAAGQPAEYVDMMRHMKENIYDNPDGAYIDETYASGSG